MIALLTVSTRDLEKVRAFLIILNSWLLKAFRRKALGLIVIIKDLEKRGFFF